MRRVLPILAPVVLLTGLLVFAVPPAQAIDCLVDARPTSKVGDHVATATSAITCNATTTVIVGEAKLSRNGLLVDERGFTNKNDRTADTILASICYGASNTYTNVTTGKYANYPTFEQGSKSDSASSSHDCRLPNIIVQPCPPVCVPVPAAP